MKAIAEKTAIAFAFGYFLESFARKKQKGQQNPDFYLILLPPNTDIEQLANKTAPKHRTQDPMLRKIYYLLSPSLRLIVRRIVFFPLDIFETLSGKREKYIPPRGMIYTGSGNFIKGGNLYLNFFIRHAGLKPNHRILDVGSGIGRMAIPLVDFLNPDGSYEGFDVVETGVKWCQKNISTRRENFRFQYIKLHNDLYTKDGIDASTFIFPYPSTEFDFVFLTSVFTHMIPDEVENYVNEIARVLKPGGSCLATFFIFEDNEPQSTSKPAFNFPIDKGNYRLLNPNVKSANVAYRLKFLEDQLIRNAGLVIKKYIPGSWKGNPVIAGENDFQDILVFLKPS